MLEKRRIILAEITMTAAGGKTALEQAEERIKAYGLFNGGNSEISHTLNQKFDAIEQRALDLLKQRLRRGSVASREVGENGKTKMAKQFIVTTTKKAVRTSKVDRLALSKSEAKLGQIKHLSLQQHASPRPPAIDHEAPHLALHNTTIKYSSKLGKNSFEKSFTAGWNFDSNTNTPLIRKNPDPKGFILPNPNDSVLFPDDTLPLDSSRFGRQHIAEKTAGSSSHQQQKAAAQPPFITLKKVQSSRHGSVLQASSPQFMKPMMAKVTRRKREPTEFERAFLRK